MNIPDMLTPEERELARLLGRPGAGVAGPSAQLDARILAMAHGNPQAPAQPQSETQAAHREAPTASLPPASRNRGWGRRRGLVSSLAVAASLVLVVGLAWQLRPLPPQPAMQHAEVAAPAADMAAAGAAAVPAAAPTPSQAAEDAAAPALAAPQARSVASAKERSADTAQAAQANVARNDETNVIEQPSTSNAGQSARAFSTAPIAPPPPPAPPAAPMPMMAPAPMAAPVQAEQTISTAGAQANLYRSEAAPARAAPPRPTPAGSTPIPHAGTKAASKAADARRQRAEAIAADSTPDIEADATLSRHQWIKRIRERHEAGDLEGAKASLRRFAHDYPEARIPRDLRPLLKD